MIQLIYQREVIKMNIDREIERYEKEIENLKSTLSKSQRKGMSDNTYLYEKISRLEDKIMELERERY